MRSSYFVVVIGDLVFFRGCSSKILQKDETGNCLIGYKNRSFKYASLINSGLLVFFRFIFDQKVYFRVRNFHGLVFLGQFSRISDGHPYPFYPEVPKGTALVCESRVYLGSLL